MFDFNDFIEGRCEHETPCVTIYCVKKFIFGELLVWH